MKISAVIFARNDNYGGNLKERATYCFNSAIDTYDEVIYVDWNSETHSLLYEVQDNINFKGNFKHIVIPPSAAHSLTNGDPNAQKCCEVLARNIGLRRATGDWLVSTNIDIIHPKRDELEEFLNSTDKQTLYTLGRRALEWPQIKEFHGGEIIFEDWKQLREHCSQIIPPPEHLVDVLPEVMGPNDDYSLIACCGDYQIAPRHIWEEIKGFEEELIYALYADTNVQKKAVKHGFKIGAIFNPAIFHIEHGKGGGGFLTGINKTPNDFYRAVGYQQKTENSHTWGFSDIDIEYEVF
tara:strand:+ start:1902 stop:2786 length:885 start_codon:yes stop_codon:yes gene_type:complete